MSALSELLLNSPPYVVQLQALDFSHSAFSGTHRVCRNCGPGGITLPAEGGGPYVYSYYPMKIRVVGSGNDLDQTMEVTFGDLGEVLPAQLELVQRFNRFREKPIMTYWEYRSDDLSSAVYGPVKFRVDAMAFNKTGCVIKGKAASFNKGRVGAYYTVEIFPMLRNTST